MSIENIINDAWENRDQVNPSSEQFLKDTAKNFAEERSPISHFRSLRDNNDQKLWDKDKFGRLINFLLEKNFSVVITSGPDSYETDYVDAILNKAGIIDGKVLNLAGKTSLLGLAALIRSSNFFIGLDSVASHIAAAVNKESITLFGPSNPVNWKPWSDKARIISQEDLRYIEVKDVVSLVDEMPVE